MKNSQYEVPRLSEKTLNFEAFTHAFIKYTQRQSFHNILLHPNS